MSETDDQHPSPFATVTEPDPEPTATEPVTTPEEPQQDRPANRPETEAEGVQAGGLAYSELEDGYRRYPQQQPVETIDDPTPTPEAK